MASGDVVGIVQRLVPTATLNAALDFRAGGSTPAEQVEVLDFDDTTQEYIDWICYLENYAGGGLTIDRWWGATTATTGNVRLGMAIRRIADDAEDIDGAHSYAFNEVTDAAPSAAGEYTKAAITFTDGADMDSLADSEMFVLRETRVAADGADTMSGDAEFLGIPIIRET
jgi:hypothetical protein